MANRPQNVITMIELHFGNTCCGHTRAKNVIDGGTIVGSRNAVNIV